MYHKEFRKWIVDPALYALEEITDGKIKRTQEAARLLIAIAYQESALMHRKQMIGPARGFWQFERGGGYRGVLHHHSTEHFAQEVRNALEIPLDQAWKAVELNDLWACMLARLLLWTDPQHLPHGWSGEGNVQRAWDYYERNWRPGKPHPERWAKSWGIGVEATDDW